MINDGGTDYLSFLIKEINYKDDKTFVDDLYVMGKDKFRVKKIAIEVVSLLKQMGVPISEMFQFNENVINPLQQNKQLELQQ